MSAMTINGRTETLPGDDEALLVDVIRDRLDLTGTKLVCGSGVCGACTVLLDGMAVKSCTVLAVQADGRSVTTIEGLAQENLHPIQEAFWEEHGLQCGYCTPAMVLTAIDLLARDPHPSEAGVRDAMAGNLCRCTGYAGIVAAVLAAADAVETPGRVDGAGEP
jgi:carbon-monoxide dehydrogenase small subunit